jgi:hypothetical protein
MPADSPDDLTRKYRRQDAVYWPRTGTDPAGDPVYGAPEDIKVRWTDVAEEMLGSDGERTISNSTVMIGFDIDPGLMPVLRLGTVADLDPPGLTPMEYPGAYEVRRFNRIPNAKGRKFLRKAML